MLSAFTVNVARYLHVLSSVWVFILAVVILVDVIGRVFFLQPLPGTKEILQNSVIAVTFLQIPLAIFSKFIVCPVVPGVNKVFKRPDFFAGR